MSNGKSCPRYQFTPINDSDIRVLELLPGQFKDPLKGRLHACRATGSRKICYEALSWTWGKDRNQPCIISLENGPLPITRDLDDAIRHIRSPSNRRLLWIDMICINQQDSRERNAQIQHLTRTYSEASQVVCWLGPATKHSVNGMCVLDDMGHGGVDSQHKFAWLRLPPKEVKRGIEDIMQRSWWQRIWVVPEAAVARVLVLQCGQHYFSWVNSIRNVFPFSRAAKFAHVHPQWEAMGLSNARLDPLLQLLQKQLESGPQRDLWKRLHPSNDALDLAHDLRNRKAADRASTIYNILDMVGRPCPTSPATSYDRAFADLHRGMDSRRTADILSKCPRDSERGCSNVQLSR